MAEDVLVPKLRNYICGSGGFVELVTLLKPSSPLGSRKSKQEAKEWLKSLGPEAGFVCINDQNDEIIGVRVDLRKKICHQYEIKGSCRRPQGKCKYWHICKNYIEGICEGKCGHSHNFHSSDDNQRMTKELGLEKHSDVTIRNIVSWSLPQVCQLYLRNECKSDKCPYLHVCSQVVQASTCKCVLSHNLSDSHNLEILKQYDLVPSHKEINVDFVRCSVLNLKNQKVFETKKCPDNSKLTKKTNDKQGDSLLGKIKTPAATAKPASEQEAPLKSSSVATPARRQLQDDTGLKAKDLFEFLCKEFNCSVPLSVLKSRRYVNELEQDISVFLEENRDKFLFTLNGNDNIQNVIAFCPKLRLCFDFVFQNECKKEHCLFFHLCRKFITGCCSREEKCPRSHEFRNKRDQETLVKLGLDWLTNDQLRQLMLSSSPQVCINYNKGACTNGSRCPRVHICKGFVVNACKNGDACRFQHKGAFDTDHTKSLLEKYRLGKISHNSVLKTLLVCEKESTPQILKPAPQSSLPKRNDKSEESTTAPHNMPSSKSKRVMQEQRPSASSSCGPKAKTLLVCEKDSAPQIPKPALQSSLPKMKAKSEESTTAPHNMPSASSSCCPTSKTILVCEKDSAPQIPRPASQSSLPNKNANSKELPTAPHNVPSSKPKVVMQERRPSASSSCGPKSKNLSVCEKDSAPQIPKPASQSSLPNKNAKSEELTTAPHNVPPSKPRGAMQERKASTSSSCGPQSSSVPANKKPTPSKKAVFACISKEYNGSAPFAVIAQRRDLFPESFGNISAWFRNRKERFRLVENADRTILEVHAFCQRAGFCFNYTAETSCSRDDCQYFHVCREYIAGVCRFGSRCKWNHSFQFDRDRKFISRLEMGDLTEEELCKVLQLSMPNVCLEYNDGDCQNGESCSMVHVCKDFVKKRCLNTNYCGQDHEEALATPRASAILESYGLKYTGENLNFILNTLLVCKMDDNASTKPTTSNWSNFATSVVRDSPKQPSHAPLPLISNAERNKTVASETSRVPRTPCLPAEQTVFDCLCRGYGSTAAFSAIAGREDLFPHGPKSAEGWFRDTKGSFLLTVDDRGTISQVDAFSARARPCLRYNKNGTCDKHDCTYLHICRDYITDSCINGVTCPLNHNFHNQRDKAMLSRIKLDQFTESELQKLVLSSTPRICVEYNNGFCKQDDSCTKIHVCCGLLRKCCSGENECGLDHEAALDTGQNWKVLERLMLKDVSKRDILEMILDDKLSLSDKDKTKCHIHQDKPDAFICSRFLVGKCNLGVRCKKHHCSMPYHWQYRSNEWESFSEEDNLRLERLYCDVNTETLVEFKPAQTLDVSRLERVTCVYLGQGYEVMVDLDLTKMHLTPSGRHFSVMTELRRLSTMPYITSPCDYVFTNWKWYWKDNGNIWRMYDKDYSGRNLPGLFEHVFLAMLDQNKTCASYKFTTSEHAYNLFLFSKEEMYQVNLKTGTKRQVKRRPDKAVSNEEMDDLKWTYGDSSVRRELEKRTTNVNSYIPSHWSSMPPSAQHTRVPVDTNSDEFREVKQLFRKSMNDQAVIKRIERVQNPFMWEKYCRKKENMKAIARRNQQQLNEKRLFHGTSPGTVEAICKQNFDWRLHGKNATRFGEGSYFAVNASYSHAYASKDASSSQFMFLAKVLVGSHTVGQPSYRRPPQKDPSNQASDLYDSCVNNQSNPTIFVVFDTDQFYPEYIIKYVSQTTSEYSYSSPQTTTAPIPKPASSRTHVLRSSSNLQSAASSQSRPVGTSGYSSTTLSSGLSSGNPNSSNILGTGSNPTGTPSGSGYQLTVNQTASAYYGLPLKSTPTASSAQSAYSASTAFNAGLTSVNPTSNLNNPGTVSTPHRAATQSSVNPTRSGSASTPRIDASQSGVNPTRSGIVSTPSRAATQSGVNPTRSGSASTPRKDGSQSSVNPTRSGSTSTPRRDASQSGVNPTRSATASTAIRAATQSSYSASIASANSTRSDLGSSTASNPSTYSTQSGYSSNVFTSGAKVTTDTKKYHVKKKRDCVIS